jgi:FAD/FMN-containing dehydrogenase/Fe-S oxidoreductase
VAIRTPVPTRDQTVDRVRLPGGGAPVDVKTLGSELARRIKGEVRFDEGSRHLYANDASIYRQVPLGVVLPKDADDVVATVEVCRRHGAPIIARGCGTGLAGQSVNVAVMIDFSKYMNQILELDPTRRIARVQPGVICDQLREAANEHGLTWAPDPATHDHCTFGGMIGNNSCGTHSVMGGKTVDNTIELDVLTYDGLRLRVGATDEEELQRISTGSGRRAEIYRRLRDLRDRYAGLIRERYPQIPRRVSGYNLDDLLPEKGFHVGRALVGTEGTCVLVLEATVRLVPNPPKRSLLVLGYPDPPTAARHVLTDLESRPLAVEFFDHGIVEHLRAKGFPTPGAEKLPPGDVWVLIEHGGETQGEADDQARGLMASLQALPDAPPMELISDPAIQTAIWRIRRDGCTTRVPGQFGGWAAWEDAAVAPERLSDYLRDFIELCDRYRYETQFFGHFGQACIHCRFDLDLKTEAGITHFRNFIEEAADLVVHYGGSLSGEHGDGQLRAVLLPKMFGPELIGAFNEFKAIWDPDGRMNPGKVVHPYSPTQNLRYGTDYRPLEVKTHFSFREDGYSFTEAADRCFGIGNCRHLKGGTMCPSFMVTREEKHSTRGRARLLFEMMRGPRPGRNVWRNESVKEALDLCLACKGCKGDCPVRVDMATYKAEFLSHYWKGRLRPASAYAMGLIYWWAGIAARSPGLANLITQTPPLSRVAKLLGGVAPERQIPAFPAQTFRDWFRTRPAPPGTAGSPVVLWPDTFNNSFLPETAKAAVAVLEDAGFRVQVPRPPLCCGRPLYDYGMLSLARALLRQIVQVLGPQIQAGIPMVVLEPSCYAVFKDELLNLLPHDADAQRLSEQVYLLSEFLEAKAGSYRLPQVARKALVQGHCHQKAIAGMEAETAVLRKMGVDADVPDSGCCGMAGSFGYEHGERYQVSMACGERVLLPEVRQAASETVIIADGFSCREQIAQATHRKALHLAEVIRMGMAGTAPAVPRSYPESAFSQPAARVSPGSLALAAGMLGAGLWALIRVGRKLRA